MELEIKQILARWMYSKSLTKILLWHVLLEPVWHTILVLTCDFVLGFSHVSTYCKCMYVSSLHIWRTCK